MIAGELAAAGYALALHGSASAEPDDDVRATLAGREWHGFVADFSSPDAAERLFQDVCTHFGRPPTLLVNSAAAFGQDTFHDVTARTLLDHYAINTVAPVLLTKAMARTSAPGGCVINILDQRIVQPPPDQLSYTISKLALAGFTDLAARALAPHIRVNAIAPGLTIATDDYSSEQMVRLAAAMPLAVLPQAAEIAKGVLYLAGAHSVTGQTIFVDAGARLRSYERDFMHLFAAPGSA